MTKQEAYYLAGPMSGIAQFNVPTFRAAADHLRRLGLEIISPIELDSEEVYTAMMRSKTGSFDEHGKLARNTWGDFLSRDVKVVADRAAGVIVLDGWQRSRGARLEVFTALLANKPIFKYLGDKSPHGPVAPLHRSTALAMIYDTTLEAAA